MYELILNDFKMKTTKLQSAFRLLLGTFMTLAGIGHLSFQRLEFQAQVPTWLPQNPNFIDFVVISSGIVEILLGLSMLFLFKHKMKVGLALALFFLLVFAGNISQYTNGIDAFGLDTDTKRLVRLFFQPVLILWALWSTGAIHLFRRKNYLSQTINFFEFEANLLNGKEQLMKEYVGKTIIVVNTASKCGLTPQYEGLEKLYQDYKDQGLVILGFPCNQFGKQEQGNASEIETFCQINYGVSFPMFDKIKVNGPQAHPIFTYLKAVLPGSFGRNVKWNFTKFVIDKTGKPVRRFSPTTKPEKMEQYIQNIL